MTGLLTIQMLQFRYGLPCEESSVIKAAELVISENFDNEQFLGAGMTCLRQAGVCHASEVCR